MTLLGVPFTARQAVLVALGVPVALWVCWAAVVTFLVWAGA